MRNDSLSLKFYLNTDKRVTGEQRNIYLRIMVNRKKAEIFTRQHVSREADWNPVAQRVNLKTPINSVLTQIESEITNIYQELKYNKKTITAAIIKEQFLGRDQSVISLKEYFEKTLQQRILVNDEFARATIQNYITTSKHLNSFLETAKLKYITLAELDDKFVKKFDSFLLQKNIVNSISRTLHRTSVNKYHTKLRALLNMAIEENLLQKNPYHNFKMKKQESKRTFLTKPELDRIEANDLGGNKSLQYSRDKFLFSVYTGLRFTDADNLKEENIEFDGTKYWISFRQQKTHELSRLPMLSKAKDIYDKYEIERLATGFVLPRLTNQKVNVYLKTIADLAGITKPLTHHVARHTSATTIFLANGVPLEIVSKQLGHSSIKTTQIYAKITNDMLSKEADKLDAILK